MNLKIGDVVHFTFKGASKTDKFIMLFETEVKYYFLMDNSAYWLYKTQDGYWKIC